MSTTNIACKDNIYITGHRNPDMDSVCSAYAYAVLKNRIDPGKCYVAVRCGHLSDNVKKIIASLNIECPPYLRDVFPKVADIYLTSKEHIQADDKLSELAGSYSDSKPSVTPIFDGNDFCGLLSLDDITAWVMKELSENGNIPSVPTVRELLREQAPTIKVDDLFTDAKNILSSSQKRGLAVFDDAGYVGFVTRRCFLRKPRHNVILVDHNEPKQSIMGIETANIIEILDHHRLDAVKTDLPIFIDAEPVGSTCTIVYRQFLTHGIMPDAVTAKVMLAGIIADTLILRSPTTTPLDVKSANELAMLCDVNVQEFGRDMFALIAGIKTRDPEEAILSDFKVYNEKGIRFGIGQCEVTTLQDINEYSDKYIETLEDIRSRNDYEWAVLMITDVLKEHSVLLCTDYSVNRHLQYAPLGKLIYDMPGVMSRKKQLLPEILNALGS